MSRYRKVEIATWSDAKFMSLSQDGKFLWLFLLTGPMSTNIPGVVQGGPAGIAEALEWSTERFRKQFAELFARGMAKADFEARLIWLPKAVRYNAPKNQNVVKGWRPTWKLIPECDLKVEIWEVLKPLGERFTEQFAELLPKPNGDCSATQDQDQEQDPPCSPPAGDPLAGESSLGKRKREALRRHRDEALRLWDRQRELRAKVQKRLGVVNARPLKPTAERVAKVAARLDAGATPEDCEHVLQVFAEEAVRQRNAQWFNGETNWREANFNRALGKPTSARAKTESTQKEEARFLVYSTPEDAGV